MSKNEVIKIIENRRSTRSFKNDSIAEEDLAAILQSGRCAPYAGDQMCAFTVVKNKELIDKINKLAKEAARNMGMEHLERLGNDPSFVGSYGAPVIIFVSGKETAIAPELDCAAAAENMLIAAEAVGLGACWVHFPLLSFHAPNAEKLYHDLKLSPGYKAFICIALGKKAAGSQQLAERSYGEITVIP